MAEALPKIRNIVNQIMQDYNIKPEDIPNTFEFVIS